MYTCHLGHKNCQLQSIHLYSGNEKGTNSPKSMLVSFICSYTILTKHLLFCCLLILMKILDIKNDNCD